MTASTLIILVAAVLALPASWLLWQRVELSRAKHPSLQGHARLARWLAARLPGYSFDEKEFFAVDGAPEDIARRRQEGFRRLAGLYLKRFPVTVAATRAAASSIPDLEFTSRYRVPFQFSTVVRQHLVAGSFLAASDEVKLTDLDGNQFYDLSGSYGVNLLGYEFYKRCIAAAVGRAGALGPVLGSYHPLVADNVCRLRAISGLDAVSFHMSGTEAVMQAVRLARYHTRRPKLVRFCGAYHGWWGDVQPGVGNPQPARDTLTLRDMDARSLRVLRHRHDIACVLVNPLQAMHPNSGAPADSSLVDSSRRTNHDRATYATWLHELRKVCSDRGIVLILDEVFTGFRLAPGGAQQLFGVQADLVTYGKTLGGGLPVGVLCGRSALMRRYRPERPADICFARGTFNSHPYVMAAMASFLDALEDPDVQQLYRDLDRRWDERALLLNSRLEAAGIPLHVVNLSTIWSIVFTEPSRYNWMLQYYLRAEGLALGWVGSGRLIFSLDYDDSRFAEVCDRFVRAASAMNDDGWWARPSGLTNRSIRRQILGELVTRRRG